MTARIIIWGNKNLAVGCTAHLLGLDANILAVVLNPDDDGKDKHGYLSLKRFAESQGLRIFQPNNASDSEFLEKLEVLCPDFIFSFSYSRIIKKNILDHFQGRIFNTHFSRLPRNRGCLPLIYALAEGETETGVTLHLVDEGIDTGDIISQVLIPITSTDTARTLYFRATAAGVALFAESYPKIASGNFETTPQSEECMTYHPQRNPNDRWIDWEWDDEKIHRFIRAHTFIPYPGARFRKNDRELEVRMINGLCHIDDKSMTFKEFIHAYR